MSAPGARAARGRRPAIRIDEARSCVLLVVMGATVSKSAICRAAELAAGQPIVVVAVAAAGGGREQVRRTVAEAMSAVEALGATALGHIAVTASPGRTLVRLARTRGAWAVVLDGSAGAAAGSGGGDLAAEFRRRVHGSGLVVEGAASEPGGSVHTLARRATM